MPECAFCNHDESQHHREGPRKPCSLPLCCCVDYLGPKEPDNAPDSVDTRILSESVGIFGMREEADMHRLLAVYVKQSGRKVAEAVAHMIERWRQYQQAMPRLEWTYGSAYKFFMSGNWDIPANWPARRAELPNPGAVRTSLSEDEIYAQWLSMSEGFRRENPFVRRGA